MKGDKAKAVKQDIRTTNAIVEAKNKAETGSPLVCGADIQNYRRLLNEIEQLKRGLEYYSEFLKVHEAEKELYEAQYVEDDKQVTSESNVVDKIQRQLNALNTKKEVMKKNSEITAAKHTINAMKVDLDQKKLYLFAICSKRKDKFDEIRKAATTELSEAVKEVNHWLNQ